MKNSEMLAYTAGLIDGEGTIALTRLSRHTFRAPVVSVASTSKELIRFLKETFGGKVISKKVYARRHSASREFRLSQDRALEFLREIRPFLRHVEKQRRADLLLRDYKRVTVRNGRYTPAQILRKKDFERRFLHPSAP